MKGKLVLISFLICLNFTPKAYCVEKTNEIIFSNEKTYTVGASYWQSSNIREWLNSDSMNVEYTISPPSRENLGSINAYDEEPGFLTNFTESEKRAIAITRRRVQDSANRAPDGGSLYPSFGYASKATSNAYKDLISTWKKWHYQIVNDKVFYLTVPEYFFYLESRGFEDPKRLSEEAKKKFNYTKNTVDWSLLGGDASGDKTDCLRVVLSDSDNMIDRSDVSQKGVVPAMHIMPEYTFSNGKKAKNLTFKEEVSFGRYNGRPIIWQVINITNEGYALLLSKEAIDLKHYNSKGTTDLYKYSNTINFKDFDVDISQDLQVGAIRNNDIELPSLIVENEAELYKRHEGSFEVNLRFEDNVGIDYILINGKEIFRGNNKTMIIDKNDDYFFDVYDVSGNVRQYKIPIYNINTPSKIDVKLSKEGWSNSDVEIKIDTSNNIGSYAENILTSQRDTFLNEWGNYNSYKSRPLRITGSVELISHTHDLDGVSTGLGLYYNRMKKGDSGDIYLEKAIMYPKRWNLDFLKQNGKQDFDITIDIPADVNNYFHPFLQLETWHRDRYLIKWTNVRYELLDKDDFSIQKIVLPDGSEVIDSSYTGTFKESGIYTFEIHDNKGNIVEKTVEIKIDRIKPDAKIEYDNSITNKNVEVNVEAWDDGSGIEKIILPNGSIVKSNKATYIASENEKLNFSIYDKAGNITIKTIDLISIDKKVDKVEIVKDLDSYTNKGVNINLKSEDLNGINKIVLPDGQVVFSQEVNFKAEENGEYIFIVYDNIGNSKEVSIYVNNIDKIQPRLDFKTYETDKGLKTIVTAHDSESGVSHLVIPNGNIISGDVYEFYPDKNKSYYFKVFDLAGNSYGKTLHIDEVIKLNSSSILDLYIKSENMISLSLNTSSINFEEFSGVEDTEKEGAVLLDVSSSLPYEINASLSSSIESSSNKVMDVSILRIKEASSYKYQSFSNIGKSLNLVNNHTSGNHQHRVDLMLKGSIAHAKDNYKTTIKFEINQK